MPQHIVPALREWIEQRLAGNRPDEGRPFDSLCHIAEVLFFASLATEEKEPTRVAAVWDPDGARGLTSIVESPNSVLSYIEGRHDVPSWDVLRLRAIPFDVASVAKISPLAEFGTSVLVVGLNDSGRYVVDGIAQLRPNATGGGSFVLRTEAPGVITMEVFGQEWFRFERGEFVSPPPSIFTDTDSALLRTAKKLEASLWVPSFALGESPSDLLRALTESMHSTKHGGLLLFLPTEPTAADLNRVKLRVLDEDILQQAYISVNELAVQAMANKDDSLVGEELHKAREAFRQWARTIGRLTALDNAVLIGPGFRVFGAQYEVPSDGAPIIYEASNIQGDAGGIYTKRHGSRHRAAACFVNEGEGRIAILSSADGPLRCFMKVNDKVVMWPIRLSTI